MNLLANLAIRSLRSKAKELYKKGNTVDEIVDKLLNDPQITQGLIVLGIDRDKLRDIVEQEVTKRC